MNGTFYLAWQYLSYNRWKTSILVGSITLIIYLPVGLNVVVEQSGEHLTARAEATPLLVGAKVSPLELVLNSLYFSRETPKSMNYSEATSIMESGLAVAVALIRCSNQQLARSGKHRIHKQSDAGVTKP